MVKDECQASEQQHHDEIGQRRIPHVAVRAAGWHVHIHEVAEEQAYAHADHEQTVPERTERHLPIVKAYRNLGAYQGEARFSTWLYSIAYRTALSKLRGRKEGTLELDALNGDALEPVQMPEGYRSDRKALVEWALAQLPPEDAAVMTFFYLQELGVDEIVTITGLGESNVKVKLHRGRKKMLAILQDHLKEESWTLITD